MGNAIIERVGGVGVDCDDATAVQSNVLTGYTFGGSASDEIQTGTMPNRGTTNGSITTNGGTYTVPEGYHSGSGKVTYTLPSVAGGTTYTPTAAAQTISLSGKYLKSNIAVAGSSNLIAKNIVSGKNIWGVAGSHRNFANVHTVYNGSSFDGFLTGGVLTNVVRTVDSSHTSYTVDYKDMNNISAVLGTNNSISSGSLYVSTSVNNSDDTWDSADGGFVSAKSINFSLFSSLRIVGYTNASFGNWNSEYYNKMESYSIIVVRPITISGGIADNHGNTYVKSRTTTTWQSGNVRYGSASSGNVAFDFTFDISGWTGTSDYLGVGINSSASRQTSSMYWDNYSQGFYITAIYLN